MNVAIQFAANWISFCKINSLEPSCFLWWSTFPSFLNGFLKKRQKKNKLSKISFKNVY